MAWAINEIVTGLTNPVILFGHFTYFLLILSMLMRRMVWLRGLAVASGLAKIVYRVWFVVDPVSVLWEAIFVLVNVIQLLLIWYYERYHSFADDERHFANSIPASIERRVIKRLLEFSRPRQVEAGEKLTREGEPVRELMYITSGAVVIERGTAVIAACGPGDYIGEMSFLTGAPASATARAMEPVRVLAFDQARLQEAIETDPDIRRAMESSLNLNLVGKLVRSNDHAKPEGAPEPARSS